MQRGIKSAIVPSDACSSGRSASETNSLAPFSDVYGCPGTSEQVRPSHRERQDRLCRYPVADSGKDRWATAHTE
jgi:hypothetical protein